MKIYTEIVFEWSEDEQKMVEVSSESIDYNGPMALCFGGGGETDRREFDNRAQDAAVDTLNLLEGQYENSADPNNSYFSQEISRLGQETQDKKAEAEDRYSMKLGQAEQNYDFARNKGAVNYAQQIANTGQQLKEANEEGARQAVEARQGATEESYGALTKLANTGLAGAGGRARKTLAARKSSGVDKIASGLARERQQLKDSLAEADVAKNLNLSEQAMALQQGRESADLTMQQEHSELERNMATQTGKLLNEQSQALDKIRLEAAQIVSSTTSGFADSRSKWDDAKWDPVNEPFDDIDDEFGIRQG
tara:strand:+ start:20030 stop:20953 length:924 start_codon:yes stop_codon:yes gene_type:complete